MNLVRDYPVIGGSGPGSFYVTFPRYRPESVVNNYFDYAHNDYIQFACESGIVGLGIIGLFVVMTLGAALIAQWRRRNPLMRGMSFACIMGVTALLIHSWVDFNLQIPANATYFMVLLRAWDGSRSTSTAAEMEVCGCVTGATTNEDSRHGSRRLHRLPPR